MIYVLKCKIQMPKEGKSFQLSIISSKYVGKAMLRSLFSFFPSWNWCLLSTTFVPGWMDNGQRVFLEIILTRRKSQPHLLISILWGSVSLSATGCHVHGQASVRSDVNDGHMHVARVCSHPRTPGVLRVAEDDSGNRPRLWKLKSLVPFEQLQLLGRTHIPRAHTPWPFFPLRGQRDSFYLFIYFPFYIRDPKRFGLIHVQMDYFLCPEGRDWV